MASWRPDPTFYPSPRLAAAAPPERLAYVATMNPDGRLTQRRPSRRRPTGAGPAARISARTRWWSWTSTPRSSTYGQLVGRAEMPNTGDEFHHFGWNACSSALCPYAPHPHVERRYLIVPGLRSSRHLRPGHQARPPPAAPGEDDRAGGGRPAHRLLPPAHRALRAGGDVRRRPGRAGRGGPGGRPPARPRALRRAGALGGRPGARSTWPTTSPGTWATTPCSPASGARPTWWRAGVVPDLLLDGKYGHALHVWDLRKRRHRADARPGRGAPDRARAAPGPRPDPPLRLRQLRRLPQGPLRLHLALAPRLASTPRAPGEGEWRLRKVLEHPRRAGPGRPAPAGPAALRGRAPAGLGHRPERGRPMPLRLLLGHGRAAPVRRLRPLQPPAGRLGAPGRDRRPRRPPQRRPPQRRAADGGAEPGRAARLPHQLPLRVLGRPVLPGGDRGLDDQAGRRTRRAG